MSIDKEEQKIVCSNMVYEGNSFWKQIAVALTNADETQYNKIKNAFPEEWKGFYNNRKLKTEKE